MSEKEVAGIMYEGTAEFADAVGTPRQVLFRPAALPAVVPATAPVAEAPLGLAREGVPEVDKGVLKTDFLKERWPGSVQGTRQALTFLQQTSLNISRNSNGNDPVKETEEMALWIDFMRHLNNASASLKRLENSQNGIT